MFQLLFIDIQVGSIATGLEAAGVGKMKVECGVFVCSDSGVECRNLKKCTTRREWGKLTGLEKHVKVSARVCGHWN